MVDPRLSPWLDLGVAAVVPQGEHEQYTLTIGMMLGIRVAVGRPQQMDDLTLMDFMQVDKYLFPPKGEWGRALDPRPDSRMHAHRHMNHLSASSLPCVMWY